MVEEDFVVLLTTHQSRLYAYILSLMAEPNQAQDVLQETNLTLWRKAHELRPGSNFTAWALQVAYFQVLACRQRQRRDRLVFDEDLVTQLSQEATSDQGEFLHRQTTLGECLKRLTSRHADLIDRHYARGEPVKQIAAALGETANSVAQALHRARLSLVRCVQQKLAVEEP
ncbi:MAG: sigma-70 family RNA polymerase sigma factor [Planctomycetia bacterium]|nr:sigma-70 family RNA polymerase sigma factor [Planctomycetia bacterium]